MRLGNTVPVRCDAYKRLPLVTDAAREYGSSMTDRSLEDGIAENKELFRALRAQGKVGSWAVVQSLLEDDESAPPDIQELLADPDLPTEVRADLESLLDDDEKQAERFRAIYLNFEKIAGEKFKALREERGWSQLEVAKRMTDRGFAMHQTTVAKLETGSRPLRLAEMAALAGVFGLPVEAVLYVPNTGQAPDVEYMARKLRDVREHAARTEEAAIAHLRESVKTLASWESQRSSLVDAMREAGAEIDREFEGDGEHPEDA